MPKINKEKTLELCEMLEKDNVNIRCGYCQNNMIVTYQFYNVYLHCTHCDPDIEQVEIFLT